MSKRKKESNLVISPVTNQMEKIILLILLNLLGFFDDVLALMLKNAQCYNISCSLQWSKGDWATTERDYYLAFRKEAFIQMFNSLTSSSAFLVLWPTIKDHWENQTQAVNTEQSTENENFQTWLQASQPHTPAKWLQVTQSSPETVIAAQFVINTPASDSEHLKYISHSVKSLVI